MDKKESSEIRKVLMSLPDERLAELANMAEKWDRTKNLVTFAHIVAIMRKYNLPEICLLPEEITEIYKHPEPFTAFTEKLDATKEHLFIRLKQPTDISKKREEKE
jgi:hypothetical protein